MKEFFLDRKYRKDAPTMGKIVLSKDLTIFTLERPWVNNEHEVSCIPEGIYVCAFLKDHVTESGTKFRACYKVLNVPNREGILIHPGNTVDDTRGCILPGLEKNKESVLKSVMAIDAMRRFINKSIFALTIRSV